ncbi:MAG: hypothetical protein ACKV2V_15565 [Blastocatellia bacterium]
MPGAGIQIRLARKKKATDNIHAWFGHFLHGERAPPWIARGWSFLEREQELKQRKSPAAKPVAP